MRIPHNTTSIAAIVFLCPGQPALAGVCRRYRTGKRILYPAQPQEPVARGSDLAWGAAGPVSTTDRRHPHCLHRASGYTLVAGDTDDDHNLVSNCRCDRKRRRTPTLYVE